MGIRSRPLYEIPLDELEAVPVWEFDLRHESESEDETWVRPVRKLPVNKLDNRIVITRVKLANETSILAMLGNIGLDQPKSTRQFRTLSVEKAGEWFHLARNFDSEYSQYGPEALANFLNMPVRDVFPITYDISDIAKGLSEVVKGQITAEPMESLTREERMRLIVRGE